MNTIKTAVAAACVIASAAATAGPVEFNSELLAAATAVSTLKAAGLELAGKCKNGVLAFSIDGERGAYVAIELRRVGGAWRVHDAVVDSRCMADLHTGKKQ